ncbi:MAG TPA: helix-turn-helix transcriptional regulator [Ilumatobacteraceae bacterium]|nr:helix-turn-helix transcriptional regulator [Ilumatobacteraceae bacterium]
MTIDVEFPTEERRLIMRTLAVGYADGTRLDWHRHNWHQLVYATSGVLRVDTRTGAWIVPPERGVWLPARVEHRLTARGRVQLRTVYVAAHLRAASRPLGVVNVSPLLRELILHVVQRGMLDARSASDDRLARFLLEQLRAVDVAPLDLRMPTDPAAAEVAALLREKPGTNLDSICRRVGAGRRTIERRFREQTGMTLGRWRQRLQLVRAIELIAEGRTVSESGVMVGYATTSAFITAFRHQLGTTPGRYFATNRLREFLDDPSHPVPLANG